MDIIHESRDGIFLFRAPWIPFRPRSCRFPRSVLRIVPRTTLHGADIFVFRSGSIPPRPDEQQFENRSLSLLFSPSGIWRVRAARPSVVDLASLYPALRCPKGKQVPSSCDEQRRSLSVSAHPEFVNGWSPANRHRRCCRVSRVSRPAGLRTRDTARRFGRGPTSVRCSAAPVRTSDDNLEHVLSSRPRNLTTSNRAFNDIYIYT